MAKQVETVLLNDLQLETYKELQTAADKDGVIGPEVIGQYNGNTIIALVNRNVIRTTRGHGRYRITNVPVASKVASKSRVAA